MNFLPPTHGLVLFVPAAVVLLLIPGPAVLYIVARSVDQGRMAGLASAAGIAGGNFGARVGSVVGPFRVAAPTIDVIPYVPGFQPGKAVTSEHLEDAVCRGGMPDAPKVHDFLIFSSVLF